jgi:ketosteroid isomerase-like protein
MFERVRRLSDEDATARAADLAERIVQEVSEADHDWRAIGRRARELAALARAARRASAEGPSPER